MTGSLDTKEDLQGVALQLTAGELPPGWDIVKTSSACLVACNPSLQVYYKEFPLPSPFGRLTALLRGSRASRWRKHSDALKYAGIDAPDSLAWGKLPNGREYLFTRAAAGQDVATWLRKTLTERTGAALTSRRRLLEALGIFIGRLHATGFLPGDLEASDVLAEQIDDRFQFTGFLRWQAKESEEQEARITAFCQGANVPVLTFGSKGNTRETGSITFRNLNNITKQIRIYGGTGNVTID